jgi:hypothetical protein
MSLYDLAVADGRQHERGAVLLGMLGSPAVARFRDAWVEKSGDGPVIAVYTRQGGGNRACFCGCAKDAPAADRHVPESCCAASNEALAAHPLYLRDADDEFDPTYATFRFRAPQEWSEVLAEAAGEPVDTDARWREAVARVERGEISPALRAAGDQLAAALGDLPADGPKVIRI